MRENRFKGDEDRQKNLSRLVKMSGGVVLNVDPSASLDGIQATL